MHEYGSRYDVGRCSGRFTCHNDVIPWEHAVPSPVYMADPLSRFGRSHARIPAGLEAELSYCRADAAVQVGAVRPWPHHFLRLSVFFFLMLPARIMDLGPSQ